MVHAGSPSGSTKGPDVPSGNFYRMTRDAENAVTETAPNLCTNRRRCPKRLRYTTSAVSALHGQM
jgi:hypothetical protein